VVESITKPIEQTMSITEKEFGELKALVSSLKEAINKSENIINERMDRLEERLFGNGSPGLIIDLVKLSESISKLEGIATIQLISINGLKEQVPSKWIIRHWKEITFIGITVFMFIHSIIPDDLSLLDWIIKTF
jgi:hypothetical protein